MSSPTQTTKNDSAVEAAGTAATAVATAAAADVATAATAVTAFDAAFIGDVPPPSNLDNICWICLSPIWTDNESGYALPLCGCSTDMIVHNDCQKFLIQQLNKGHPVPCSQCNVQLEVISGVQGSRKLLQKARLGCSMSQLRLAQMFQQSNNMNRCIAWAKKSASSGNRWAQSWLGHELYQQAQVENEELVVKDQVRNLSLRSKDIDQLLKKNLEKYYFARELFEKASAQGDVQSTRMLGDCNFLGQGGLTNSSRKANRYWSTATKLGSKRAAQEIHTSMNGGLKIECFNNACSKRNNGKKLVTCEICVSGHYCSSNCLENDVVNHKYTCDTISAQTKIRNRRTMTIGNSFLFAKDLPGKRNEGGWINLKAANNAEAEFKEMQSSTAYNDMSKQLRLVKGTKEGKITQLLQLKHMKKIGSPIPCFHCLIPMSFKEIKKCANCKNVYYCSSKCQSKDWSKHRKLCRVLTKGILHPKDEDFPEEYVRFRIGISDPESGTVVQHQFEITDTLKSVKQSFAEQLNTDIKNIKYGGLGDQCFNEPSILSSVDDEGRTIENQKYVSSFDVDPAAQTKETNDGTIVLKFSFENGDDAAFKVQANMKMKISFGILAKREGVDITSLRFFSSGNLIDPEDTPNSLHLKHQDVIHVRLFGVGLGENDDQMP